ncbi:MAG: hypothetical protein Sapg2KO_51910 [Saprospiraceae bacterium]
MAFLKKLFGAKPISNHQDFWNWFQKNEKRFFYIVKSGKGIERVFFRALGPKLKELRTGYYYLTGMADENTAELIFTADGDITNIVFVEELIAAAPELERWKFTAHKQASAIENVGVKMHDLSFAKGTLFFYAIDNKEYPDEIDICIVHEAGTKENEKEVSQGVYLFLDIFLGELAFIEEIDNLSIISPQASNQDLVPIEKLKNYLKWRKKEFVEKYEGTRRNTENDSHQSFELTLENGDPLFALFNVDLLKWDSRASHPWIVDIEMPYEGENGLPDDTLMNTLNQVEDELVAALPDQEGYLFLGHETGQNTRLIFFACKEFRKPSKILSDFQQKYQPNQTIKYSIYKDKYWRSFNRYERWYLSSL